MGCPISNPDKWCFQNANFSHYTLQNNLVKFPVSKYAVARLSMQISSKSRHKTGRSSILIYCVNIIVEFSINICTLARCFYLMRKIYDLQKCGRVLIFIQTQRVYECLLLILMSMGKCISDAFKLDHIYLLNRYLEDFIL